MKNFRDHLLKFKNKLDEGENFAFSRYSDGELYILQNGEFTIMIVRCFHISLQQ